MKTKQFPQNVLVELKGSALVTVIILTSIMALLTASMLRYSTSERKGNERNRLILRAKNMAENITLYAAEQLTTKLYRMASTPTMHFPWSGTSLNRVYLPPDGVLTTSFTEPSTAEVRAGIENPTALALIDDVNNPNDGLQVSTAKVPIIAKVVATHPAVGNVTAYVQQDMEIALTPLFQFGMFFNMDLELYPSPAFTISGPVHTNNRLMAHPEWGSTNTITFRDRVTTVEGLFADHTMKVTSRYPNGTAPTPTRSDGNVIFRHRTTGVETPLKNGSSLWRDHKYLRNPWTASAPTTTELGDFKTFAKATYDGNLRTNVTPLQLPGIGTYKETDDPGTVEDDRNNGRQIIEPPNPKKYISGAWTEVVDTPAVKASKLSWKCGLYIVVNPDATIRSGTLPDETGISILPQSYRCWLNIINTSTGVHTLKEVILPGQPAYGYNNNGTPADFTDDYMYRNNMPNRYDTGTSVGSNQVLRTALPFYARVKTYDGTSWVLTDSTSLPSGVGYSTSSGAAVFPSDSITTGSYYPSEAYFFDMRRANGNWGYPFNRSATNIYTPRPITKIDFDMARFKMMVARTMSSSTTLSCYNLKAPGGLSAADWSSSIFNASGAPASHGLGMGASFDVFPAGGVLGEPYRQDPFQLYYAPSVLGDDPSTAATQIKIGGVIVVSDPRAYLVSNADLNAAWYDGIAIYIHSLDAEVRAQTAGVANRIDSGVRLWNGRGPVASLTGSGVTGLTLVTNDSMYIIGHFNADGTIDSDNGHEYTNGYSGKFPDSSNEKLCALMADAINIMSQPTWGTNATYDQTSGWSDALSTLPHSTSTANWRTSDPSASNTSEGQLVDSNRKLYPGLLPTASTGKAPDSSGRTTRFSANATEISTALVVGLVPSNHIPDGLTDHPPRTGANGVNTGGANNFPRMHEAWPGGLFIRGSMVALFESRVAMEPFTNGRNYGAPGRYWGLHQNFKTVHDVPLEPIVLSATRIGFKELTASEYAAEKSHIESL